MKTEQDIIKQKKLFEKFRQQYFEQIPPPNTDTDTTIEVLRKITETKIVDNVLEWVLDNDKHIFFITGYMTSTKNFDGFPLE